MLLFIPTLWINTLFIIILLLVLFHLIIVAFYPNPLDQYFLHYYFIASFISSYYCCFYSNPLDQYTLHYYFLASFIPSYYCCFLSHTLLINTFFIIILLLVLFHLIIVAFYSNPLDQYTLHYYFIASFIPSYYCCFLSQPSWSIYSSLLFYC